MRKCIKQQFIKQLRLAILALAVNAVNLPLTSTPTQAGPLDPPHIAGQWSPVYDGDIVAVHMIVMPDGKVLNYAEGGQGRPMIEEIRIWDPVEETLTTPTLPPYDLFCSGHSVLPDGRVFIQGGHDEADAHGQSRATIYDPFSDTWDTSVPNMNAGRWYATNTILPNGDVLVLNGAIDGYNNKNDLPQVWQLQTNTWRNLITAEDSEPTGRDFYPRMFVAPDGRVFKAGPDRDTWFLDTSGTGQWTRGPDMKFEGFRGYGSAVMFEEGKILVMGGADNPPTNTAEIIDLNDENPQWKFVAPMHHARRHLNATLMADGKVLVTSGTSAQGFNNGDGLVTIAEIYDPATDTWEEVAAQTHGRAYHSNAVLLPDGRVQIGGGGRPAADGGIENPNLEIYSPPYLFQGTRPVIAQAPSVLSFGDRFDVALDTSAVNPEAITAVHFIRLGATTHAFNQTQSINRLSFTPNTTGLTINAPSDPNRAQPGHYMLFVLADGVPSVATMVKFGDAEPPSPPTDIDVTPINPTTLALSWPASTDNIQVVSYSVYLNGEFIETVNAPASTLYNLDSSTDYTITIVARDLYGNESTSDTLRVTTDEPGLNPPQANPGIDFFAAINQSFLLDGSASKDVDGQELTYTWSLDGNIIATVPILHVSQPVEGDYLYTLTVSDGEFTDSASITVTVVTALNVLENGTFEDGIGEAGILHWEGEAQTGTAAFSNTDGRAHIHVTRDSPARWMVQVMQRINLVAGTTYTLDFDMQSDAPSRDFSVVVEEIGTWIPYMSRDLQLNAQITPGKISGETQHFTLQWTQPVTTNNAKVGFHVGASGLGDIWLDNVFLSGGNTGNLPPIAIAGPDSQGYMNFPASLDGSLSYDPNYAYPTNSGLPLGNGTAPTLTYSWVQVAGLPVILSDTDQAKASFITSEPGLYTFALTVSDGEFSHTNTVSVTMSELFNIPPQADAGASFTQALGRNVKLNGSASTDPDAAPFALSYQWVQLTGPSVSLNDVTLAEPYFTPTQAGSYTFGLVVNDGDLSSPLAEVTVTVADIKTQNLLANGSFAKGLENWQSLVIDDADALFTPTEGKINVNVIDSGTNNWSLQLYQTLALEAGKNYTLKVDASAKELPRSIRFVVEHFGPPWNAYFNEVFELDTANTEQTIFIQWPQTTDDSNVKIGFYFGNSSNTDIWLDNAVLIDSASTENSAPVANAGLDKTRMAFEPITLNGTRSQDPDTLITGNVALNYVWEQTAGPAITLQNAHTATPTFTPTKAGVYTFALTVDDGELSSSVDTVTLLITTPDNQAPIANAGPDQQFILGGSVTLDGSKAFDPDNLPTRLSYQWQQTGGLSVNLLGSQTATPSFAPVIAGSYVFSLVVNDGDKSSLPSTVVVTVKEPNIAPAADAGQNRRVYLGDTVTLDGSNSIDPDGGPNTITYQWQQISGNPVTLSDTTTAKPHFTADTLGKVRFTLLVFDGELTSLASTVTLKVVPVPNTAPKVTARAASRAPASFSTALYGKGFDAEGDVLSFSWQQLSGPTATIDNATQANTHFTPALPGTYVFKLTASDGQLSSNKRSINPAQSLMITDKSILQHFDLKSVLEQMLKTSADHQQSPADIMLALADLRQDCGTFNGFPEADNSARPRFCSSPGASMDSFLASLDTELTYYRPIALVNRYDLANNDGSDCGEYRIAYAGNDLSPRINFFIFEARLPNPKPQLGLAGCRPVVEYWANLSQERDPQTRANLLHTFFFKGIKHFAPAISAHHFAGENRGSGAIRLNARVDQRNNWVFMQFRTQIADNCAPSCTLGVAQEGLKDTPFPALAGIVEPALQAKADAFQQAVLKAIHTPGQGLLANTVSRLDTTLPFSSYLGRQHSGLAQTPGVIEAMSPAFEAAIAAKLAQAGSTLTPTNIITRVHSMTCAGCHNQHSDQLGAPLILKTDNQTVEFLSTQLEAGPDGQRYTVKPAMKNLFLPERIHLMQQALDQSMVSIQVFDGDEDNDGVIDRLDSCLGSPSNALVNAQGCALVAYAKIEAEHFQNFKDKDKQSVKNKDTQQGPNCGPGVDLIPSSDAQDIIAGQSLTCIQDGEWLEYTVALSEGVYELSARLNTINGGGRFQIKLARQAVTAYVSGSGVPPEWQTYTLNKPINVKKGVYTVKVKMLQGGFDLNWVAFEALWLKEYGKIKEPHYSIKKDTTQTP
ncbi:PKD domain-containing protein [Marinagarivorans algicola]|uniref:PKD domain-containing protein n=1 Tax=Marinagarivorans algicola TaxID=1513270 RepID=UPI0006B8DA70|nr:REJ domain-containing protein [Marinagarivorans algicola]